MNKIYRKGDIVDAKDLGESLVKNWQRMGLARSLGGGLFEMTQMATAVVKEEEVENFLSKTKGWFEDLIEGVKRALLFLIRERPELSGFSQKITFPNNEEHEVVIERSVDVGFKMFVSEDVEIDVGQIVSTEGQDYRVMNIESIIVCSGEAGIKIVSLEQHSA
jgi:hypothetical protein